MTGVLTTSPLDLRAKWDGPVIDADVHAVVPSLGALMPYMSDHWQAYVRERGFTGPVPAVEYTYPSGAPSTVRPEWRPADGRPAASDVSLLRADLLDPLKVDLAILNCYYGIDWIRHPDVGPMIARAVNDWIIHEWLDKEPRLRASMVVPGHHPEEMVREIRRVGGHPGFVQVMLPVRTDRPWGNRLWHPVIAALVDKGLAMNLHWGGTSEFSPTPTGWASWYAEEYAAEQATYIMQLLSIVGEGTFQAFPDLRVTFQEGGFTWLPSIWWRMEAKRKGARRDVPWLNEPVWELLRDRVRFTVAPLDAGPPEELARIVRWLGSDDMLMFASDYPHRHDDDIQVLLDAMTPPAQEKLMSGNARAFYRF
ncbi:amidohydrolase family protein [Streptomyces sp. cg40]|uniref:amidohydrolase family protein n=1 Tax=Streptomyces sp. cg40 TaxID=3419764 RepID=UPI003CFF42ED